MSINLRFSATAILLLALLGCTERSAILAPEFAQPNTRPARNFTSFNESLRCMDRPLANSTSRSYLISSTEIPDETRRVYVGADDMLINAINQLNRSSRKYIFLDQARISDLGQLELETTRKEDEIKPQLYIRGSISQLDSDVSGVEAEADWDRDTRPSTGLTGLKFEGHRKLSVVSVDMHLVQYPSRRIIPGASVANSMVVVSRSFGA